MFSSQKDVHIYVNVALFFSNKINRSKSYEDVKGRVVPGKNKMRRFTSWSSPFPPHPRFGNAGFIRGDTPNDNALSDVQSCTNSMRRTCDIRATNPPQKKKSNFRCGLERVESLPDKLRAGSLKKITEMNCGLILSMYETVMCDAAVIINADLLVKMKFAIKVGEDCWDFVALLSFRWCAYFLYAICEVHSDDR